MTLTSLMQPMTAKQLSQMTEIREDSCSFILQEFLRCRIVTCLNSQARRSRLYWLTEDGKKCQKYFVESHGKAVLHTDFPVVDWNLYGWVCYTHRTAILKTLTEPLQPAVIRRKILHHNPTIKISANNVSDILRLFLQKSIIEPVVIRKKVHPFYRLTELGIKLQKLLHQSDVVASTTC